MTPTRRVMQHFKLPLIVTAIVLPLTLVTALLAVTWIFYLDIPNAQKAQRAELMGNGIAKMGCIIMAPFWFFYAATFGNSRRKKLV